MATPPSGSSPPPPNFKSVAEIVAAGEKMKKEADLLFGKRKFEEAVEVYAQAVQILIQERGGPLGEGIAVKCFAHQAQCFIKLEKYENALKALEVAVMVPSSNVDLHMYSKLWHRRATCLEKLGKLPPALACLDRAIGVMPQSDEFRKQREELLTAIVKKHGFEVPLPDCPEEVTREEVAEVVDLVLKCGGQPERLKEPLVAICKKRGNIDTFLDNSTNIMWAVCQAAVARAGAAAKGIAARIKMVNQESGEEEVAERPIRADDVLPMIDLLVRAGAKTEQRYVKMGNSTPVQLLSQAGAVECLKYILKRGGSAFAYDDNHWSPLLVACSPTGPCAGNNSETVKLLLEHKAPVGHRNAAGVHALSLACQAGDVESVQALIDAGSPVNMRCKAGFSPIAYARMSLHNQEKAAMVIGKLLKVAGGLKEQKPQLIKEMQEDIQCCESSAVLSKLMVSKEKMLSGYTIPPPPIPPGSSTEPPAPPKEVAPLSEEEVKAKCWQMLFSMLRIPMEYVEKEEHILMVSKEDEDGARYKCTNILEMIYVHLFSMLPNIFHKRFRKIQFPEGESGPPDLKILSPSSDSAIQECLTGLHPFEQCWLNELLTADTGPKEDLPHLIDIIHGKEGNSSSTQADMKFYQTRLYEVFVELIEGPILEKFSVAVPISASLDYLLTNHMGLTVVDNTDYWTKLLKRFHGEFKSNEGCTFQNLEVNSLCYATDRKSRNTDLISEIGSLSSNRTLLLMYDYTNLDEVYRRSRPEGMSMVETFSGSTIVLVEVFYDYNHTGPQSINYITDDCYMSTVLSEKGYKSSEFEFTRTKVNKGITSVTTPEAKGEESSTSIKSMENSAGVHVISTPSWCFKKTLFSVWKRG